MPLVASTLSQGLTNLVQRPPYTPQEVGERWARIYGDYASRATSILGGSPVSVVANQKVLSAALAAVFATSKLAPASASQMASAFTAFWFSPPLVFTGAFPGVVTLAPGGPALQAVLLSTWASNYASRAPNGVAMTKIAACLDAFTRLIIVTHATVPDPTFGPLT